MKKLIALILSLGMLFLTSCNNADNTPSGEHREGNIKIDKNYINSKKTGRRTVGKYHDDMFISFTDVAEYYGYEVVWADDYNCKLSKGGEEYDLNTQALTLKRKSDGKELINDFVLNDCYYCLVEARALLLGTYEIEGVLGAIGINVYATEFKNQNSEAGFDRVYIVTRLSDIELKTYNFVINGEKMHIDGVFTHRETEDGVEYSETIYPLLGVMEKAGFVVKRYGNYATVRSKVGIRKTLVVRFDDCSLRNFYGEEIDLQLGPYKASLYREVKDGELYCSGQAIQHIFRLYFYTKERFVGDEEQGTYIISKD